jgi:hypothetical protein
MIIIIHDTIQLKNFKVVSYRQNILYDIDHAYQSTSKNILLYIKF